MRLFKHTLDAFPIYADKRTQNRALAAQVATHLFLGTVLFLIIFVVGVQVGIHHGRDLERSAIAAEGGRP